jgi:hypothetical protein
LRRACRAGAYPHAKGRPMWDFIVVAIAIVSFGLFYAYTLGCDRL